MAIANFLANLWGFSLIIVCLALLVKPKHLKNLFVAAENETALLFLGMFNVVLGVISLLAYNTWDKSWAVIITIVGWLVLIKGIWYLFAPESVVAWITKWKKQYATWFPTILVIGVVIGCILVYFGMSMQ